MSNPLPQSRLIVVTIVVLLSCCARAELPAQFVGHWQGLPQFSVLGPFPAPWNFTIAALPNTADNKSAWLMGDSFGSSFPLIPCSQQQFWVVEGESVTYCGSLRNFFARYLPAPISVSFNQTALTPTMIQWCYQADCSGVSWTLSLTDPDTLSMSLFLPKPVHHIQVTLTRMAAPTAQHLQFSRFAASIPYPLPPPCNLSFALQDHSDQLFFQHAPAAAIAEAEDGLVRCPVTGMTFDRHAVAASVAPADTAAPPSAAKQRSYQHCYVLNPTIDVALSWTLHLGSSIDIEMSAPLAVVNGSFLAIGFQPQFPGMVGADIALGYLLAGGSGCVRSMYADQFVGTPVNNPLQVLTDTSVTVDSTASPPRMLVRFSRALNTGHHNITYPSLDDPFTIMWAIGPSPSSCTANPSYHGPTRGVRCVDWLIPAEIFPEFMKCHSN